MMNILNKFKWPIIFIIIAVIGFVLYSNFAPKPSTTATAGLTDQKTTQRTSGATNNQSGVPGQTFVNQLLAIQNIRFNTDLLKDPVFLTLQDLSRSLDPEPVGRPNPFAPLDGVATTSAAKGAFGASTTTTSSAPAATSTAPRIPTATRN